MTRLLGEKVKLITFLILCLCPLWVAAQNPLAKPTCIGLNLEDAEIIIADINTKMTQGLSDFSDLMSAEKNIAIFQKQAESCLVYTESRVKTIDKILGASKDESALKPDPKRVNYLLQEKQSNADLANECRFYSYRAQETIDRIMTVLMQEKGDQIFLRVPFSEQPATVTHLPVSLLGILATFDEKILFNLMVSALLGLCVGLLCIMCLHLMYDKKVELKNASFPQQHQMTMIDPYDSINTQIIQSFKLFLPLLFILMFTSFYLKIHIRHFAYANSVILINDMLLMYMISIVTINYLFIKKPWVSYERILDKFTLLVALLTLAIVMMAGGLRFIFHAELPFQFFAVRNLLFVFIIIRLYIAFLACPDDLAKRIYHRVLVFVSVVAIGLIGDILLDNQFTTPYTKYVLKLIYFCGINISLFWLFALSFESDYFKTNLTLPVLNALKHGYIAILGLVLCLIGFSYPYFNFSFARNFFGSIVLFFILQEVSIYIGKVFAGLHDQSTKWGKIIHERLDISSNKQLIELSIIRVLFNLPILFVVLFGLMEIWGASSYEIQSLILDLQNGVQIFGLTIYPSRLIHAANEFCILLLLGRALAVYISNSPRFTQEKHRKATVVALITYIMFSAALIVALVIAGINFSGIALIAGALSVGIGFGLQNLASDFVSGLILLITKPVKIGDHVVINASEGYITKIGLFSTQMTTLLQSNVIFPNATLINQALNNYTLHDKMWRLNIQIYVEISTDLKVAEQIMIETARKNPNVITTPPNLPSVLFELTLLPSGMQAVVLDLWCVIQDVDIKHIVTSQLNTQLVKEFAEAGVKMKAL